MLFVVIRFVLVVIGTSLLLSALPGVVILASDHEWGRAGLIALGGAVGAWLIRVGWYGTFSGEPRKVDAGASPRTPNTR